MKAICPNCGERLTAQSQLVGKIVKCGKCDQPFTVTMLVDDLSAAGLDAPALSPAAVTPPPVAIERTGAVAQAGDAHPEAIKIVRLLRSIEAESEISIDRETYRSRIASNWLRVKDYCAAHPGSQLSDSLAAVYAHHRAALQIWDAAGDLLPLQFYGGGFGMSGAIKGMAMGLSMQVLVDAVNDKHKRAVMERMHEQWRLAADKLRDCEDLVAGRPVTQRLTPEVSHPTLPEQNKDSQVNVTVTSICWAIACTVISCVGLLLFFGLQESNPKNSKTDYSATGGLPPVHEIPVLPEQPRQTRHPNGYRLPVNENETNDGSAPPSFVQPKVPPQPLNGGAIPPPQNADAANIRQAIDIGNREPAAVSARDLDVFDAGPTVELPPVGSQAAVVLGEVDFHAVKLDLMNPQFNPRTFKMVKQGAGWQIEDGERRVARIYRDGARIMFIWESDASHEANCLRNVLITLTAGTDEATVALRNPKIVEPILIDFSKREMNEPLDAEFLAGLKPATLKIELLGLTNETHVGKYQPLTKQAPIGKHVLAFLSVQNPESAVSVGITARPDGITARVVVAAQYCVDGSIMLPFTVDRVRSVARANAGLAKRLNDIAMPIIEKKGAVQYRVFYMAGEHEVTLISTSPSPMKIN